MYTNRETGELMSLEEAEKYWYDNYDVTKVNFASVFAPPTQTTYTQTRFW